VGCLQQRQWQLNLPFCAASLVSNERVRSLPEMPSGCPSSWPRTRGNGPKACEMCHVVQAYVVGLNSERHDRRQSQEVEQWGYARSMGSVGSVGNSLTQEDRIHAQRPR
jgi:hypothetical protein